MKNIYKYFDSVSEFGRLGVYRLRSRYCFYCYIKTNDRVIRVTIEREDELFFVAKLYYKGSRAYFAKYRSISVFGCCRKIYDNLAYV